MSVVTKAKVVILGGGMVGMLAKFLIPEALVLDWRKVPPRKRPDEHQFGAMYLWQPLDGIPCHPVRVMTTVDGQVATLEAVERYKNKIGKPGDTADWQTQFRPESTGYRMKYLPGLPDVWARYGVRVIRVDLDAREMHTATSEIIRWDYLISAIPLDSFLVLCGWIKADGGAFTMSPLDFRDDLPDHFEYEPICIKAFLVDATVSPERDGNVVLVNYLSDPSIPAYRTTDRSGQRHVEWLQKEPRGRNIYGIPTRIISPGKIWPHPHAEDARLRLTHYDVYTFGRFPRWAPDELLHESFKDLHRFAANLK